MIEDKDQNSYYFNPKDIVVDNINKIIPWWNFYHKITKDDIISFSSFNLTKKANLEKLYLSKQNMVIIFGYLNIISSGVESEADLSLRQ